MEPASNLFLQLCFFLFSVKLNLKTFRGLLSSALNVAACMAILLLMKIGVFSFMNMFQTQGQKVIKKYYANLIGDDLADNVFPNKQMPPSST